MRGLLVIVAIAFLPALAQAEDAAEAVAAKAQRVHEDYCAEVAATKDEGTAARGIVEVGEVWAEVAEVHQATASSWLLYWRGVLAQCIGQEERAVEALIGFVEGKPEADGLGAMAKDARKRLSRLKPEYEPPAPPKPPKRTVTPEERARSGKLAGGAVLAVGAAGAGVVSGAVFGALSETHTSLTTIEHATAQVEGLLETGDGQLALGIGLGVGAAIVAVASGAAFAGAGKVGRVEVAAGLMPTDGGMVAVIGGRW